MPPLKVKTEIDNSAAEAVKVIAQAAEEAAKVIANAAAEAIKISALSNTKNEGDHDLLIEVRTEMRVMKEDIKELGSKIETQVKIITDGTDLKLSDHEKRIRSNEKDITRILTYGSALLIIMAILEVVFSKIIK